MVRDAEQHREEDLRLRELTDARNELDTLTHRVETLLADRGDSLPVNEKARAENMVAEGRQALKQDTPIERVRVLNAELAQLFQSLSAQPAPNVEESPPLPSDEDVIDAEFSTDE